MTPFSTFRTTNTDTGAAQPKKKNATAQHTRNNNNSNGNDHATGRSRACSLIYTVHSSFAHVFVPLFALHSSNMLHTKHNQTQLIIIIPSTGWWQPTVRSSLIESECWSVPGRLRDTRSFDCNRCGFSVQISFSQAISFMLRFSVDVISTQNHFCAFFLEIWRNYCTYSLPTQTITFRVYFFSLSLDFFCHFSTIICIHVCCLILFVNSPNTLHGDEFLVIIFQRFISETNLIYHSSFVIC